MKTTLTPLRLIRVTTRLMCLILFLIWGFVFVSHLYWFFPPEPVPPVEVWFGQIVQLSLVVSFPLMFWKPKPASILMIASAFIFFFLIVGSGGAIAYFVMSILPSVFYFWERRILKQKDK
ncbi:MAG: hypothetical protein GYA12_01485 [Chloroflexi bacterium]|nr:hypothetical protein [Chloroflexota bacterium]